MELQTIIDDYLVELDTDMEGHGDSHPDRVSGCWISFSAEHDTFSASLEALMAEGCLTHSSGRQWHINQKTIDEIEEWSLANGY